MTAIPEFPLDFRCMQRAGLLLLLALLSTMVVAESVERLTTNPDYDELGSEQVFEDGAEWRSPPPGEYDFRTEPPVQNTGSRFTFGFDPQYEGAVRKGEPLFQTSPTGFDGDRPTTLFRFDLKRKRAIETE